MSSKYGTYKTDEQRWKARSIMMLFFSSIFFSCYCAYRGTWLIRSLLPPRTNRLPPRTVQEYLAHKKQSFHLGPRYGPRHSPTVGSYGVAVSYKRGTP